MEDRLARIEARITALEWVMCQMPFVLAGEIGIPERSVPDAVRMSAEAALRHGNISETLHVALTRLADQMQQIPENHPEFLKELRRDGL